MVKEDFLVYEAGTSPLHRANPVLKLIILVALATIFSGTGTVVLLVAMVVFPILMLIAGLRPSTVSGGSLFIGLLVLSFGILNLIDIETQPFALSFASWRLPATLLYCLRIMIIYFYNALFYATTSLSDLRRSLSALESRFFPSIPHTRRPSLTLMLFLKFIPMCIAEWHELDRAWASRCGPKGARRIFSLIPKFITRMLRKALDIAAAMTIRALS